MLGSQIKLTKREEEFLTWLLDPQLFGDRVQGPTQRDAKRVAGAIKLLRSVTPGLLTIQIPAANFIYFPFQIVSPVTVAGNFQASGGSGNDIEVVIGPKNDVLNALNGHGGSLNYISGKLTSGNILLNLSDAGDYLIAFNNRFSAVSAKVVSANVRYTPR